MYVFQNAKLSSIVFKQGSLVFQSDTNNYWTRIGSLKFLIKADINIFGCLHYDEFYLFK